MRRAPSMKRLADAFPSLDTDRLARVRRLIQRSGRMDDIDRALMNHGVECILRADGSILAEYSNSGDTYAPTILRVFNTGHARLTTVGDFVEAYERRHARLP